MHLWTPWEVTLKGYLGFLLLLLLSPVLTLLPKYLKNYYSNQSGMDDIAINILNLSQVQSGA